MVFMRVMPFAIHQILGVLNSLADIARGCTLLDLYLRAIEETTVPDRADCGSGADIIAECGILGRRIRVDHTVRFILEGVDSPVVDGHTDWRWADQQIEEKHDR